VLPALLHAQVAYVSCLGVLLTLKISHSWVSSLYNLWRRKCSLRRCVPKLLVKPVGEFLLRSKHPIPGVSASVPDAYSLQTNTPTVLRNLSMQRRREHKLSASFGLMIKREGAISSSQYRTFPCIASIFALHHYCVI